MVLPGKIMFISDHGDPLAKLGGIQSGGQNVYVREMVRALDSLGLRADVFTHWSDPRLPQVEPIGRNSRVVRLAAGSKGFHSKHKMFDMLPLFMRDIKDFAGNLYRYTIIHTNYWLSGWVGLQLQRALGIPRVHTSHSLGSVRKGAMAAQSSESFSLRLRVEKELLQGADRVIATTPIERKVLMEAYSVSPGKIKVVPCGVDTSRFRPPGSNITPYSCLGGQKKIVLFVGRFEENKGLKVLLRSMSILKKEYPLTAGMTRLVIAGGDSLERSPEKMSAEKRGFLEYIRENGISDLVTFTGPLSHEVLPAYLAGASVTVVPSYYESFGLVAVEAMACGCPVIASRTGGLQHNILHGRTGLLVEPKNPEELAKAVNYLLTREEVRKRMSREAALHGKQFSWQRIAASVAELYKEETGWKKITVTEVK